MALRQARWAPALLISLLLAACGGGGGDGLSTSAFNPSQEPNAPQATGNSATDSINWFNYRRLQIGLPAMARNSRIDAAAYAHSNYQTYNGITHVEDTGKQGFTGVSAGDRLTAAGYQFTKFPSLYGEVIVRTVNPSGFNGAEDLIAAIYHRFVIFEPVFKELGSGSATASNGDVYMTTNFTANGLDPVLGAGRTVVYPFADQQRVSRNFFSDSETPDPVPSKNEVGYPISIHADYGSVITVQSFTVQPRGGAPLPVQLLTKAVDAHTSDSVASIIPLNVLAAATTYDVQFTGTVDGVGVNRSWSFTTR
jgi:uncharacterized protein YkwD